MLDADPASRGGLRRRLASRFGAGRVRAVTDLAGELARARRGERLPGRHARPPRHGGPGGLLRDDLWVSDVVYFPLETELIALARRRGCRVVAGGGMAVHQAVGAFEHFTGRVPDAARMGRHFASLTASCGRASRRSR